MKPTLIKIMLAFALLYAPQSALAEFVTDRHDDLFRKYTKRYFGPGFDWRFFKAQGMAESNLSETAKSWVGARGIMQLMPSTFQEIQSKNPEMTAINDAEWNIAAGIYYNRQLWNRWTEQTGIDNHYRFMFGSYNAGRGTLLRAQGVARSKTLDPQAWTNIQTVAPEVPRWRHTETLGYVRKIEANFSRMDDDGRVIK